MSIPKEADTATSRSRLVSHFSLRLPQRAIQRGSGRTSDDKQNQTNTMEKRMEAASVASFDIQEPSDTTRKGWKYRSLKVGPVRIGPFASGSLQLRLLGLIFFCGPGMFAGLTGLGGGGLGNPVPVNNSLIANYASSAIFGFFAGPVCTRLGFRLSLMLGGAAFSFYSACLLIYKQTQAGWLLIFGGVALGILSSFEWTAQGTMMMTYPLPHEKGKHVSFNLTMFNLGASLGSLVRTLDTHVTKACPNEYLQIVLLQNLHTKSAVTSIATYVAFVVIMFVAVPASILVVPSECVIRSDGSLVVVIGSPTWTGVIKNLARRLRSDPHIIGLFPMFFVSNFYLPYVFNDINLATFNIRTRALNVVLFYGAGVAGAYSAGCVLDAKSLQRTTRVKIGLAMLIVMFSSVWGGAYAWQQPFTRPKTEAVGFRLIDFTEKAYAGPLVLFIALGFVHFVFQNCIYWFMTVLAENSATASTADFAGFFKSLQAVGAAIAWRLSNLELPFKTDLALSWGLSIASVVIAAFLLMSKIRDAGPEVTSGEESSSTAAEATIV